MPNPNPTRRTRRPALEVETLPPGMTRRAGGLIMYRFTERGDRRTVYGRTIDECLAKRYAPAPEVVSVDERTTLAAWLELWLGGLALRPNTIDGHRYNVEHYLVPLFGDRVRLADVSRELVELRMTELRAMTTRGGRPLAPRTVALAFATLRAALNAAVDRRRIPYNPAARVNPNGTTGRGGRARRVGVELPIPSELELRRVIRSTTGEPWHALLALSASTGLRQSEALGLGVYELEEAIATRWLHVHRALRRSDRTIDDTKNETSSRYVAVSPSLVDTLRAHLAEQERRELVAGARWHNPDRLAFTTDTGAPLAGSTVSHWFADACERAEVRPYRWHDLRHYYASNLLARGVSIAKVAKLLGHSSVVITSTTYHHVIRDAASLDEASFAGSVLEAIG
jgi:integrase